VDQESALAALDSVRSALDGIEDHIRSGASGCEGPANFDALELPQLVCDVVDGLIPILKPYEAAIYWWMLRNSLLSHGRAELVVSVNALRSRVVHSSSGQTEKLSPQTVTEGLRGLADKGAVLRVGEVGRDGTPYRIKLPREIPACQERLAARDAAPASSGGDALDGRMDYYNTPELRREVWERDEYKCAYCGRQLTEHTATLDHQTPVSFGGDNSKDNLVTACLACNSRRRNKPVMEGIIGTAEDPGHAPEEGRPA